MKIFTVIFAILAAFLLLLAESCGETSLTNTTEPQDSTAGGYSIIINIQKPRRRHERFRSKEPQPREEPQPQKVDNKNKANHSMSA